MTEEKTDATPMTFAQMFWRKLREHSTAYRADEPAPLPAPEPAPPEPEPEGEQSISAEKLHAYTAYMQRGGIGDRIPSGQFFTIASQPNEETNKCVDINISDTEFLSPRPTRS